MTRKKLSQDLRPTPRVTFMFHSSTPHKMQRPRGIIDLTAIPFSGWLLVCTLYLPWTLVVPLGAFLLKLYISHLSLPKPSVSQPKSLPALIKVATSTPCSSTTDAKVIHVESHPTVSALQTQAINHGAEMPD